MTETLIADYSFSRPDPATLKAHGFVGVVRYVSGAGKALTKTEANRLHKAGLYIWLVYETTADRALAGHEAGRSDAIKARGDARALGYPDVCPIIYAVDADVAPVKVAGYFAGVASAADPSGVYGSYLVVTAVVKAHPHMVAWQTAAWSGGKLAHVAALYQRVGSPVTGTDENVVCKPITVWRAAGPIVIGPKGKAPKPAKPIKPRPKHPKPSTHPVARLQRLGTWITAAQAILLAATKANPNLLHETVPVAVGSILVWLATEVKGVGKAK